MKFFSIKPEAFGLEISDFYLRVAKLEKAGSSFKLVSFGEFDMSPGLVRGGEIKDQEKVLQTVRKSLPKVKGRKIKSSSIVTCLPEEKAFLSVAEMPKMSSKQLEKAVSYEAENYIPFSREEVYLDFQEIPSSVGKKGLVQEVLIAAFPKKIADPYLSLLNRAGLWPLVFETESMAVCRALIPDQEGQKETLFLVDLDEARANFTIFFKGSIRFSSFVSLKDKKLSTLAEEINKYIEYYHSHYVGEDKIKKILFCGAKLLGDKELQALSRETKVSAERGNPWGTVLEPKKKSFFQKKEASKYAKVLGLALRAARIEEYD